jgi:hypothetical protein
MSLEYQDRLNQMVEYIKTNVDMDEVGYTYSRMCIERCSLRIENPTLYNKISDLIDDFGCDNDFDVSDISVEEIFDELFAD